MCGVVTVEQKTESTVLPWGLLSPVPYPVDGHCLFLFKRTRILKQRVLQLRNSSGNPALAQTNDDMMRTWTRNCRLGIGPQQKPCHTFSPCSPQKLTTIISSSFTYDMKGYKRAAYRRVLWVVNVDACTVTRKKTVCCLQSVSGSLGRRGPLLPVILYTSMCHAASATSHSYYHCDHAKFHQIISISVPETAVAVKPVQGLLQYSTLLSNTTLFTSGPFIIRYI